eukprot:1162035-Pelagomonas_calceolata.AAC.1
MLIKEKNISRAEAPCVPSTKKKEEFNEDHEGYLQFPCLTSLMQVDKILFKSVSGAQKFISALDRMSMNLKASLVAAHIYSP